MEPTELETIETQYWVDQAEALERLMKNKDFKTVILEGFFKDRVINQVSLLAEPGIKQQGERPNIMEDLVAVSNLQYHFKMIRNLGAIAQDDMDEATRSAE